MDKQNQLRRSRGSARRFLWLSQSDVTAARRLLALMAEEDGPDGSSADAGRRRSLDRAREAFGLRPRRIAILGATFAVEAPFELLLALYVSEVHEPMISITRLAVISCLSPSTTLRWVDTLAAEEWIWRTADSEDGRMVRVGLTEKARGAMDRLFGSQG